MKCIHNNSLLSESPSYVPLNVVLLSFLVLYGYYFCLLLVELREEQARTAHIAAAVTICILVVFVVLFAVYVYLR